MTEIESLGAACDALHKVATEMTRRRLLAQPDCNDTTRRILAASAMTDAGIEQLAADAFHAACVRLIELEAPGVTMHSCTADDMEKR